MTSPLITNDAITLGIFLLILTLIFRTAQSKHPTWQRFYDFVPALLLCYIFPATLNISGHAQQHGRYFG